MRPHTHRILLLGAVVVALCLLAWTRAAGAQERRSIAQEAGRVQAKAEKLDANGDGWLGEDETRKGHETLGPLYSAVRKRVDANGDGRISVAEYAGAQIQALKQADRNQDGWIDREEAQAHKRKLVIELLTGR